MAIKEIKYGVNPVLDRYYFSDGAYDSISTINKFGRDEGLGTSYETLVFGTNALYTYPSAATTMTVSSSDANDTSAGTGARTVVVSGLDGNYAEISETVTLNGQTGVSTTNSFLRVFRLQVTSAGSGEENAGVIYVGTGTVTAGVPANTFGTIPAGENQSLMAIWTVPAGYTAFMNRLLFSSFGNSNVTVVMALYARPEGQVFQVKQEYTTSRQTNELDFCPPLKFDEKTDIEIRGRTKSGSADCSGAFNMVYVKNET